MSDAAAVVLLVGRILFSVYFLFAAMGHLMRGEMMVGYARAKGAPLPSLGGWPAGVYLLVAGLSVLLGVWPEIGTLLIALFVLVMMVLMHNFWVVADEQAKMMEQMNFFRNVTYLGGALFLFASFAALGAELQFVLLPPLIQF